VVSARRTPSAGTLLAPLFVQPDVPGVAEDYVFRVVWVCAALDESHEAV